MVAVSLKKDFFQAEDGIRDTTWSRGLGDVYKRQAIISEEISVDLERPRDREKIEQDPTYLKIKMRLEKHLLRETRAVEEVT